MKRSITKRKKSISFCVTCRNRLWQLKQTLARNLAVLDDDQEISLVNYGSEDGLSKWVWSNFKDYIDSEKLNFFDVKNDVSWNVSKAKNLAHRISNGEYLFNLDADNFITKEEIKLIEHQKKVGSLCHQWTGDPNDGSYGRIGCTRSLFFDLGGYDEGMLPMGMQDVDFLRRSKALTTRQMLPKPHIAAVRNTITQKVAEINTNSSDSNKIFSQMVNLNNTLSKFKLLTEKTLSRNTSFTTYRGVLNGKIISIDGFDQIITFS